MQTLNNKIQKDPNNLMSLYSNIASSRPEDYEMLAVGDCHLGLQLASGLKGILGYKGEPSYGMQPQVQRLCLYIILLASLALRLIEEMLQKSERFCLNSHSFLAQDLSLVLKCRPSGWFLCVHYEVQSVQRKA